MTLGGFFLCVAHTRLSAVASVRQVPAVCRGAFGSFCRALVVAHMANVEACPVPFAKYIRCIACTLRGVIFLFGSFRLALTPPVRVKKFPNEFADCVPAYMLPTADHTVQAYYRVMLLRGCAHMNPPTPPQTPPRACSCSHFSGVS